MTVTTIIAQTAPRAPETPRSLELLVQHVRTEAPCPQCGAEPGKACKRQRRQDVHMARFAWAYREGLITAAELAVTLVGMNRPALLRHQMAAIIRTAR